MLFLMAIGGLGGLQEYLQVLMVILVVLMVLVTVLLFMQSTLMPYMMDIIFFMTELKVRNGTVDGGIVTVIVGLIV
jgi:hypothetical protein